MPAESEIHPDSAEPALTHRSKLQSLAAVLLGVSFIPLNPAPEAALEPLILGSVGAISIAVPPVFKQLADFYFFNEKFNLERFEDGVIQSANTPG